MPDVRRRPGASAPTGSAPTGSARVVAQLALAVLAAATGFVVAILATLVSRLAWRTGAVTVPWGLVLAVAGSAAVVVLARGTSRPHGLVAAGGWVVGLVGVLLGGPGGDYLVASDAFGQALLLAGTAAVVVAAVWGRGRA
ncbi:MAG: hypothetical protein ACRDQA_18980 [Nocardioidaceae bacterium]